MAINDLMKPATELEKEVEVKLILGRLIGLRAVVRAYALQVGLGMEPDLELPFADHDGRPIDMGSEFMHQVVLTAVDTVEEMILDAGAARKEMVN
jgi:hypothetical protein